MWWTKQTKCVVGILVVLVGGLGGEGKCVLVEGGLVVLKDSLLYIFELVWTVCAVKCYVCGVLW